MYERNHPISNKSFTLGLDFVTNNAMMRRVLSQENSPTRIVVSGIADVHSGPLGVRVSSPSSDPKSRLRACPGQSVSTFLGKA